MPAPRARRTTPVHRGSPAVCGVAALSWRSGPRDTNAQAHSLGRRIVRVCARPPAIAIHCVGVLRGRKAPTSRTNTIMPPQLPARTANSEGEVNLQPCGRTPYGNPNPAPTITSVQCTPHSTHPRGCGVTHPLFVFAEPPIPYWQHVVMSPTPTTTFCASLPTP